MPCLTLEILSYERTPVVLQMLGVARHSSCHERRLKARVFAINKFLSVKRRNIEDIEAYLSAKKFNICDVSSFRDNGGLQLRLSISPNHPHWADTRQAGGANLRVEAFRAGLESLQLRVALLGVKSYPTALTARVALDALADGQALWRSAFVWVVESLRASRIETAYFGGADISPSMAGGLMSAMANNLDTARGGCDANKWKFDGVHDFMICPRSHAERLTRLVGGDAVVENVGGPSAVMVVWTPRRRRQQLEVLARADGLLAAPRAALPEAVPGPSIYPIHSLADYRDLDARGMVPRVAWDEVVHPLISGLYADALGVHPEATVVLPMHRLMARDIERDVARSIDAAAATPEEMIASFERLYRRYINPDYARRLFDHIRQLRFRQQP
jgi:hypothetical protein